MYPRTSVADRRQWKAIKFEYHHPKNKYVIRRQNRRLEAQRRGRRLAHEVLAKMAADGNEFAQRFFLLESIIGNMGAWYM